MMKIPFENTFISYKISGSGPPIVWLHGFLEFKEIWEGQISFFNTEFTNIAIDLLGHGGSGCSDQIHSMELQAKAVITVLEFLEVSSCSIVGHSMGGYVALAILEYYPSMLRSLALVNSTSMSDTKEKKKNRARAMAIVKTQKAGFVRMGIINLFTPNNKIAFQKEIDRLLIKAQQTSTEGIYKALEGMMIRTNRTEVLNTFNLKKLIVVGKKDPILSCKLSKNEAIITNSALLELDGGHMSYIEDVVSLREGLAKFLKV